MNINTLNNLNPIQNRLKEEILPVLLNLMHKYDLDQLSLYLGGANSNLIIKSKEYVNGKVMDFTEEFFSHKVIEDINMRCFGGQPAAEIGMSLFKKTIDELITTTNILLNYERDLNDILNRLPELNVKLARKILIEKFDSTNRQITKYKNSNWKHVPGTTPDTLTQNYANSGITNYDLFVEEPVAAIGRAIRQEMLARVLNR